MFYIGGQESFPREKPLIFSEEQLENSIALWYWKRAYFQPSTGSQ
jgi:hypothetical protein